MEPVWNGILTCDYERTRPDASRLEWDLYTRSLIRWPAVLMGEPVPYGRLRRPGIVDVLQAQHEYLTAKWHELLASPAYTADLMASTGRDRAECAAALNSCGTGTPSMTRPALRRATALFLRVNSAHIVNWLLPEDRWEKLATQLLGTRADAQTCLSALQLPDSPGHILAAHDHSGSAGPRARACERRDAWRLALLLAAGDGSEINEARALTMALGWAATSEERRQELRSRYLATVETWCTAAGRDPARITAAELLRQDPATC